VDLGITTQAAGARTVVAVTGELDVHTATDLQSALRDLIDSGSADVIVDLRELEFLDSTGLGVLVRALKWAREAGGGLQVIADDDKIVKVFTITGLGAAMSLTRVLQEP